MATLKPKGASVELNKRGTQGQLSNMQVKMGAYVPDGVPLNREWRRRLKRAKK